VCTAFPAVYLNLDAALSSNNWSVDAFVVVVVEISPIGALNLKLL